MVFCCDAFDPQPDEETQATLKGGIGEKEAATVATVATKSFDAKTEEGEDKEQLEEILVSVTLPAGVSPGQKIEVRSPDGRRTVDTVVPNGLKAGQTFLVRFPPSPVEPVTLQSVSAHETDDRKEESPKHDRKEESPKHEPKSFAQALEDFFTPTPDPDVQQRLAKSAVVKAQSAVKTLPSSPTKKGGEGDQTNEKTQMVTVVRVDPEVDRVDPKVAPSEVERREDHLHDDEEVEAEDSDSGLHLSGPESSKREPTPKADRQDRLSLVRSLEDFLTPVPDPQPVRPDSPKTLPSPSNSARPNRFSPRRSGRNIDTRRTQLTPMQQMQYQNRYMQSTGQRLVQVQVPPGFPPGSTIFVEIPGENRTVAAQVPPNVSSFHVAYTPQMYGTSIPPPTQAPAVVVPKRNAGREKLLSVRVPPGTPPGTTLHVSVPDEPGRILAAQVPPGNVTKFHVSYMPSEHFTPRGMLPPANPYKQSYTPISYARDPPMSRNDNNNGGWGDSFLPAAFNHFADSANDIQDYVFNGGDDGAATGESWEGYDF